MDRFTVCRFCGSIIRCCLATCPRCDRPLARRRDRFHRYCAVGLVTMMVILLAIFFAGDRARESLSHQPSRVPWERRAAGDPAQ